MNTISTTKKKKNTKILQRYKTVIYPTRYEIRRRRSYSGFSRRTVGVKYGSLRTI